MSSAPHEDMEEWQQRIIILEHRMDTADEQNRRFNEELIRSRHEVNASIGRLDQRIDGLDLRIDALGDRLDQRIDRLSQNILGLSAQFQKMQRWMLTAAIAIITLLPITLKLADRFL